MTMKSKIGGKLPTSRPAAAKAGLLHYFAEQEGPFSRMDQLQAARVDYDYLAALHV